MSRKSSVFYKTNPGSLLFEVTTDFMYRVSTREYTKWAGWAGPATLWSNYTRLSRLELALLYPNLPS